MKKTSLGRWLVSLGALIWAGIASAETLSVDVAENTTFAAWLEAKSLSKADLADYSEIALSGAGHLTVADELVGYAGDVRIAAGAWMRVTCPTNGLGASAGTTYVADGGTLEMYTADAANGYFTAPDRPVHIAGAGVGGNGAYRYGGTLGHNNVSFWPQRFFLDGDAKIVTVKQDDWKIGTQIDMNGHTLDYKCGGGRFMGITILHPGHINILSGTPLIQSGTDLGGGPTNVFTVKKGAGLKWWGQSSGLAWRLVCENGVSLIAGYGTCGWGGPVELQGTTRCTRQEPWATLYLPNYVTGKGGFTRYPYWEGLQHEMYLKLCCPTNDFQGGIAFYRDVILPTVNGAIPANGGAVALTNGTVRLTDGAIYTLPAYVCCGTGLVQNADGVWKKVTKEGAGDLVYASRVGAPELEIRQGAVRLANATGFFDHLYVADASVGDDAARSAAANALFNSTDVPVTRLCHGTGYLYENVNSVPKHWQDYSTYIVSGYIWNRTDADVTWTFALCYDDRAKLFVNGVQEIYQDGYTNPTTKAVTLKPGANRIVLRVLNWTGGGGASTHADWQSKAFSYYVGETASKDPATFTAFTAAKIAEFLTPHDGTPESAMEAFPVFTNITCAAGAVFDSGSYGYTLANLTGAGAFTNGSVTVTNRLAFTAADANAGAALEVAGTLTLGAGVTVDVADADALLPAADARVVARAQALVGSVRASDHLRAARWFVRATDTTITLHHAAGSTLIVR